MKNENTPSDQLSLKELDRLYLHSLLLTLVGWADLVIALLIVPAVISLPYFCPFSIYLIVFSVIHMSCRSKAARIIVLVESIVGLIGCLSLAAYFIWYFFCSRDPYAGLVLFFLIPIFIAIPVFAELLLASGRRRLWGKDRLSNEQITYAIRRQSGGVSADRPPARSNFKISRVIACVILVIVTIPTIILTPYHLSASIKNHRAASAALRRARNGDVDAQYAMSIRYSYGDGVWHNLQKSIYWLRKAAEQGHAEAQYELGMRYKSGSGVEEDLKQAAEWLRKAAAQGHKYAPRALEELEESGI